MNEQRNYTITIKADKLLGGKKAVAGNNNQSDTEKGKGLLTEESAKKFGTAMVAYRTVKSFATQIASHEVSMVQLRTGSNELQERANFVYEMHEKGLGIVEGAVTGALIGGLPGFIVGTGLSLLNTLISYGQRQNEINTQKTVENVSIQMNYIRAGANGSRRANE